MTRTVNVDEAKMRLSGVLARVEAGEEVVIARDNTPVAKLPRLRPASEIAALLKEMIVVRKGRAAATAEELMPGAMRADGFDRYDRRICGDILDHSGRDRRWCRIRYRRLKHEHSIAPVIGPLAQTP